jgi:hypothetical protein
MVSLLNVRWLVPAVPHTRAPAVYPSVSWHLRMCRSLKSPSPTYHKRHHQKRNLSRYSWWFLRAQQLRTRRLRSNNRRTMTPKTRPTKNTVPRAIPKPRRCTEMLTRQSPSGLNLRSLRQTLGSAGAPGHHHHSKVKDQGSLAFRASGVQGRHRDFLQIQSPLPTQGTNCHGDGTPPGCGGGAEHSSANRSARDRDSSHSATKSRRHHLRLHEDGRGSGQRPLHVRHRHLDSHLLGPKFKQGVHSEQPLPQRIPQSLGVT